MFSPLKSVYTLSTLSTLFKKHIRIRFLYYNNMVRSTEHICKDCNKIYASYQSLCNHRTKFHKQHDNPTDNPSIIIDNPSIISTPLQIETVKTYDCRYCKKDFAYFQNRWRHEKICKTKNEEIIEKNKNSQIIENNGTMNTNNGTINNTTNITINNYGKEDTSYVSEKFMLNIIRRLIKNDEGSKDIMPHLIKNIYCLI